MLFLLWGLVSIFILGVFAWSVRILFAQRSAWKAYGKKLNMTYQQERGFLGSGSLSGSVGPFAFGLFTAEERTVDARGQRFSTVIEIGLRQGLPAAGAVGTAQMAPMIRSLILEQSVSVQDADWDKEWIIRTRHAKMMEAYLTPARLEVFKKVFRMKIISALFIFNDQDAVLRVETMDPLANVEKLERIVKGLTQMASNLVVGKDEWSALSEIVAQSPPPPIQLPPVQAAPQAAPAKPDVDPRFADVPLKDK